MLVGMLEGNTGQLANIRYTVLKIRLVCHIAEYTSMQSILTYNLFSTQIYHQNCYSTPSKYKLC